MLRPSEAQRVMEISLGKLANIRSQRVASSLHKNLLVAKVLNQVKTFVSVDEQQQPSWEMKESSGSSALNNESVDSGNENRISLGKVDEKYFMTLPDIEVDEAQRVASVVAGDPGNSESAYEPSSALFPNGEAFTDSPAKEDSGDISEFGRGYKRRLECGDGDFVTKRRRYVDEDSDELADSCNWRSPVHVSDAEEDGLCGEMDSSDVSMTYEENMMDVEQISSLVNVFSTSFKGLGHLESSVDDQVLTPRLPDAESCDQRFTTNRNTGCNTLRRGLSLPDLCAKQAELLCQKFQQNPPVLALTV